MPLTLVEIQSLIGALGVKIPDDILALKAKAEEFKVRREKVAAEASGKPPDWRLQQDFDGVLKRALDAAGKQQFDPALKLLDEADQLLLQPNSIPAAPALPVWQQAKEAADAQLNQLYEKLKRSGIPVLVETANEIEAVLGNYRTKLVIALTAYDNAAGAARDKVRAQALEAVGSYQSSIPNDKHIIAADTNPFGVRVTIREILGSALATLSTQLRSG